MSQQEPKSLKEARYALFVAEGKLYSVSHEWSRAKHFWKNLRNFIKISLEMTNKYSPEIIRAK